MGEMNIEDYRQLVDLLDGRIDRLTKPIPSMQILRFAEGIKTASHDTTYTAEDYENLLLAKELMDELLPQILTGLRSQTIDPESGWHFVTVDAGDGDHDLCAICETPFQHFRQSVKVHCIDMHHGAMHGVCRDCVREHGPADFVDRQDVDDWLNEEGLDQRTVEQDPATESRRVDLVDAVRRHAHSTWYFSDVARKAAEWSKAAFGEWR